MKLERHTGKVEKISARATTILTNDNISIIVPNSEFMQQKVINWSHNDYKVRFRIPVSVSYSSDVEEVSRLLLEVASEDTHVLKDPKPAIRLNEFGNNGIHFELLVWTTSYIHRRGKFISDINMLIIKKVQQERYTDSFPTAGHLYKAGNF